MKPAVYVLGTGSAFFYGLASVLQHQAAVEAPDSESMRIGLLVRLAQRPMWALGALADVAALVLQALALSRAPLTLIQPLLTTGLLFALILHAARAHRWPPAREFLAAFALIAGLTLLVAFGSPTRGRSVVSFHRWVGAAGFLGLGVAVLVIWARKVRPRMRPVVLAVAGAVAFAASDALLKTTTAELTHHGLSMRGVVEVLDGWSFYALIVVGALALLLVQSAFQAGPLELSLPTLTAVEPIAGSVVGVWLFHEAIRTDPIALTAEAAAAVMILFGIWVLGRSPNVVGDPVGEQLADQHR